MQRYIFPKLKWGFSVYHQTEVINYRQWLDFQLVVTALT